MMHAPFLRENQSASRLCETRVNSHQDDDRITVVIAPILLLPYVKNCVLCQGMPAVVWVGARETLENDQFSSWRSKKKRSGPQKNKNRQHPRSAGNEHGRGGPHVPKHNTTEPQVKKRGAESRTKD